MMLIAAAVAAPAILVSTAAAKEEVDAVVVCGAERCRELRGEVVELASTITMHAGRRPSRAAPFYDVFLVFRMPGGTRTTPGGALRYVPSEWVVRSRTASGDGVWFRVRRRLGRALRRSIRGLAPRPASALNAPASEIGPATVAAQRGLVARAKAPDAPASGDPPFELVLIAAPGAVATIAGLLQVRRYRRRSSIAARPS